MPKFGKIGSKQFIHSNRQTAVLSEENNSPDINEGSMLR